MANLEVRLAYVRLPATPGCFRLSFASGKPGAGSRQNKPLDRVRPLGLSSTAISDVRVRFWV
jgi:hypothetical protein